jgi:hypothetical protein
MLIWPGPQSSYLHFLWSWDDRRRWQAGASMLNICIGWDEVFELFTRSGFELWILSISTSQVAGIIGVSHCAAQIFFF